MSWAPACGGSSRTVAGTGSSCEQGVRQEQALRGRASWTTAESTSPGASVSGGREAHSAQQRAIELRGPRLAQPGEHRRPRRCTDRVSHPPLVGHRCASGGLKCLGAMVKKLTIVSWLERRLGEPDRARGTRARGCRRRVLGTSLRRIFTHRSWNRFQLRTRRTAGASPARQGELDYGREHIAGRIRQRRARSTQRRAEGDRSSRPMADAVR